MHVHLLCLFKAHRLSIVSVLSEEFRVYSCNIFPSQLRAGGTATANTAVLLYSCHVLKIYTTNVLR